MVRRGIYTKTKDGETARATYLPKDNKRVKVLRILHSQGRMNQNKLLHSAGLTRSHWKKFGILLTDMKDWGWITKEDSTEYSGGKIYDLTDKGTEIAELLKDVYNENSELLENFEMFFEFEKTN